MAQYGLDTETTEHLHGMVVGDAAEDDGMPWDSMRVTGSENFKVKQSVHNEELHLFFENYNGVYPDGIYYGKLSAIGVDPQRSLILTLPAQYMYLHFHDDAPPVAELWIGNQGVSASAVVFTKET